MTLRNTIATALVAGLGLAPSAYAQSVGDTTFGGGLSVFGPTLEGSYQFEPLLRLRGVAIGGLSYSDTDEDDDGNAYDIDLSVAAAAILVDHYPKLTGWRLSGGLLFNLSDFQATGTGAETEPFEINGRLFDGGEVLGEAEFVRNIAPMVTVGYEHAFENNWVLSGEVGAIFTGGFATDLTANSDLLQAEVDINQDFQDFQSDARSFDVLPYMSVAVSFRF